MIGAYVVGSLAVVPVTALIVAIAVAFGPLLGFMYSLLGCLTSAGLTYGVGFMIGRQTVQRFAGEQMSHLSHRMARHGVTAILIVRMLPLAPFTVVNVMAGASAVRFRDFILGTFLGMLPGLLLMTLFGDGLQSAIRDPKAASFMILVAVVVAVVLITLWLRRRFVTSETGAATESAPVEGDRAPLQCPDSSRHGRRVFGGFL